MSTQIPFGLRGTQLLDISQVSRGLECNCICPSCKKKLIARKGKHHQHHFAHYRKTGCTTALETALHLKSKSILSKRKAIVVPHLYLHRQSSPLSNAQLLKFERTELEKHIKGVTPDVILIKGSKRLFVEIAVTHLVDTNKLKRIRKLNIPVIEINALSIYEEVLNERQVLTTSRFEHALLHGTQHKKWLYNPKKEGIEFALRKQAYVKPVVHRLYKGYHNYYVKDCPLKKRTRQVSAHHLFTYANVFHDCSFCNRCLEVQYEKEWVGFRETIQQPRAVVCWGQLEVPKKGAWWSPI